MLIPKPGVAEIARFVRARKCVCLRVCAACVYNESERRVVLRSALPYLSNGGELFIWSSQDGAADSRCANRRVSSARWRVALSAHAGDLLLVRVFASR